MSRRCHVYTDSDVTLMRAKYCDGKTKMADLALQIGVSVGALKWKASCLGISRHIAVLKPFTPTQDETIISYAGRWTVASIAAKVKRTPNSVSARMAYLGIQSGYKNRDSWFTHQDTAKILGLGKVKLRGFISSGALKAQSYYETEAFGQGRSAYRIEETALREFIRAHPREVNGRLADMVMLVDVLAGVKA